MQVYLFGSVRIGDGNEQRALTGASADLFALLLHCQLTQRAATRTTVANLLFPDMREEEARRKLTHTLYRLRQELSSFDDVLTRSGELLAISAESIDVQTFQKAPQQNLHLYTDDYLIDIDADWVIALRVELRERFLAVLPDAIASLSAANQPELALRYAQRWVHVDPLNEAAHVTTMRLLSSLNRHANALQQYEQLAQSLANELDLKPLASTQQLAEEIRQQRHDDSSGLPFINRHDEQVLLRTLLASGSGFALLEGPAGIGKSRLLREVAPAQRCGFGKADEQLRVPHQPLIDALHAALADSDLDELRARLSPLARQTVAQLVPNLQSAEIPSSSPQSSSASLQIALRQLITAAAPLTLIIDDIQWLDAQSWALLPLLVEMTERVQCVLLLGFRSEEMRALAHWALVQTWQANGLHIMLQGLSAQDSADLLRSLGSTADSLPLHLYANGNPLHLQTIAQRPDDTDINFTKLLSNQLKTMDDPALDLLKLIAVYGDKVPKASVQALQPNGVDESVLLRLTTSGLLVEELAAFRLQHDLIRAEVLALLNSKTKRQLHHQIADYLREAGGDLVAVAQHYQAAKKRSEALELLQLSAENAINLNNASNAIGLTKQALALLDETIPAQQQLTLRLQNVRAHQLNSWTSIPRSTIKKLEAAALTLGDAAAAHTARMAQLNCLAGSAQFDKLRTASEAILEQLASQQSPTIEASAYIKIAYLYQTYLRDADATVILAERALQLAETLDQPATLLSALLLLAEVYYYPRRMGEAKALLSRAEALYSSFPVPSLEPALLTIQALIAQADGDIETAYFNQRWLAEHCERHGDSKGMWSGLWSAGQMAKLLCLYDESEAHLRKLVDLPDVGDALSMKARARLVASLVAARNFAAANAAAEPLIEWLQSAENGSSRYYGWYCISELYLRQGDYAQAQHYLELTIDYVEENGGISSSVPYSLLAEAQFYQGELTQARRSLAHAATITTSSNFVGNDSYYYYVRYLVENNPQLLATARQVMFMEVSRHRSVETIAALLTQWTEHCLIEQAWMTLGSADVCTVDAVRIGVGFGRKLSSQNYRKITLTLNDPHYDPTVSNKTTLRRQRMMRLTAEAIRQSTLLTDKQLATLLGVSVRTIERDRVAFTADNRPLHTRKTDG